MMQRAPPAQQPQSSIPGVTQAMMQTPAPPTASMANTYGTQQQSGNVIPGSLSMPNNQALAPGQAQTLSLQHQQASFQAQQQLIHQQQQQQQVGLQPRQAQQHQTMFQQQPHPVQQVNIAQQQQNQHHLQHIPHQGLNGGWQSDTDTQDRRKMIAKIVQLLQQRKPNAPPEWLKKLPQMAKRLEESLYRMAPSFESYNDFNTLKTRLQQLALNLGKDKKKNPLSQGQLVHQQNQQAHFQVEQRQLLQQRQQAPQQLNGINTMAIQPIQQQPISLQQPQISVQLQQQQPPRQMVNMSDINPIMGQSQPIIKTQQLVNSRENNPLPQVTPSNFGRQPALSAGTTVQSNNTNSQKIDELQKKQQQSSQQQIGGGQKAVNSSQRTNTGNVTNAGANLSAVNGNGINGSGSDRQQVLRHQQQRLLLLRHAAKCPHEDGRCPVTPHCAGMKRLWKHIAECKDQKCLVPHCVSSRYVLSHYHRCKDVRCPVCGPVREAIHRSHEKAKQQQLQQRKARNEQTTQHNQGNSVMMNVSNQRQPQHIQPQQAQLNHQQNQQSYNQQQQFCKPLKNALAPGAPLSCPVVAQPTQNSNQKQSQKRRKTSAKNNMSLPQASQPNAVTANLVNKQQVSGMLTGPVMSNLQQPQQQFLQQPQTHQVMSSQLVPNVTQSMQQMPQNSKPGSYPGQPTAISSLSSPNFQQTDSSVGSKQIVSSITKPASGPTPQEDHTLLNCFSTQQIETHITSLNKGLQLPPQKLKLKCHEVVKMLQSHQHGWVFNTPVDPVELGLPDYFHVIKRPMDLGTIKKYLENGRYHSLDDFEADVHLTFDNAMLYNQEGSVVHNMAREMKDKFAKDYGELQQELNAEEDEKRKNGDACSLCGCEKLLFEPPVFYCNGINCPSKRIRRNTYYYVGGSNQFHWCHQCFGDLKEGQCIDIGDVSLKKTELLKKKNDEVHEESWVQCDKCERWIHQICALFNTRQNKDQRSEFTCPRCMIAERKLAGRYEATSTTPMAKDLPRTKLSEWLENSIKDKTQVFLNKLATIKAETENISVEAAKRIINFGPITIRQVTSMDRKLEVRDRMKKRYAFRNYPSEFTYRCKCITVFQNLDGVDVILFGLYVYEHDEKNPAPNQRSVYISYLDNVHYMRPRRMRTFVYHEILIAYLDYVRRKGFSQAHIWACPPLKGDDYILYAKPEDQKTPKDDRLRQWYLDLLRESQRRGVVGRLTNMYDLYFANEKNDASVVPYMEGDYFPAEAENIIKDIQEGKGGKKNGSLGKKKNKKERDKSKTGRGGTRSTGIDEEALAASGIVPPGVETKSLEEGGRDFVMTKLGETIYPMRESFIVAFLCWEGAKEENLIVPKDVQEFREKHNIICRLPKKEIKSEDTVNVDGSAIKADRVSSIGTENSFVNNAQVDKENKTTLGPENKEINENPSKTNNDSNNTNVTNTKSETNCKNVCNDKSSEAQSTDKPQCLENRMSSKRDSEGRIKPDSQPSALDVKKSVTKDSSGRLVKVIDDDAEELDCEFLNNRQAFLNLCQGNHYQFDQLRRAKHTSMMVLWHLHNRDAPKFVQQCAVCSREILTGYRYHCPICADYDQCQECAANPATLRHPHQLKPIPVGQQSELTEAQRKERQRSIQLHMQLLFHAATCVNPKCPSANCTKMKGLLKHGSQCQVKATGGCHVCKRIWALLQIHARQCKQAQCPVPNCMAIRERFRQLTQQQQAMDDRRRQEMNRAYRGASR